MSDRLAEKLEKADLATELLANAGLLHQLAEAERERDEARGRWWQTTNLYNESTEAAGIWMRESQKAEATIARTKALVAKWRKSGQGYESSGIEKGDDLAGGIGVAYQAVADELEAMLKGDAR